MTATTKEQPFEQAQAALLDSQRAIHERCPRHVEAPAIAPRANVEPVWRIIAWYIGVAAVLAFCLWLLIPSNARGAEPRAWVIWDLAADKPYHPHKFVSPTACNMDAVHLKDGNGRRLACVRINSTKGE